MGEHLLIVDDDMDTLRLVGMMLEKQGYTVTTESDPTSVENVAQEIQPDLIIMDITMPGMDGYQVTRLLRENHQTFDIPIIMLTAKGELDDKVSGFESGVDDYLTKPTQPRELFAHVRAILARSTRLRAKTVVAPKIEHGKVIGVLAAKGGLGVSAFALRLSLELNKSTAKNVILAEYRPGQGSLGLYLGVNQDKAYIPKIMDIPPGDLSLNHIQECLVSYTDETSQDLLDQAPGTSPTIKLLLSTYLPRNAHYITHTESFRCLTRILSTAANYLVLDLGPSLPPITEKILEYCDHLVILLSPFVFTVIQTRELLRDLESYGIIDARFTIVLGDEIDRMGNNHAQERALNHAKLMMHNHIGTPYYMSLEEIQEYLGHDVICLENIQDTNPLKTLGETVADLIR